MGGVTEQQIPPQVAAETVRMHPEHHKALKTRIVQLEKLCGFGPDEGGEHHLPAWLRQTPGESRWSVTIAIALLVALQLLAPKHLAFQPKPLLPGLEILLYVLLTIGNPVRIRRESKWLRAAGLLLMVSASLATAWSAVRLVYELATGHGGTTATPLLLSGGAIWLTNVIVFALWYWEFDRGGPAARAAARRVHPDFVFTQMTMSEIIHRDWEPTFLDYVYLSFTNATAFSPTDTLPLTRWAKLTMMFQSIISLVTVALVVARAVNIFT
jgi:uncharacterized membrane protein